MSEIPAKAAPKKKAAPRKSLIKYAEKQLKPADGSLLHPIYSNNPDRVLVLPRQAVEIDTGLEIAIPPAMVLMTSNCTDGFLQIGGTFHGYQKSLTVRYYNLTDRVLEIDPYQKIGHIFLAEIKSWK